MDVLGLGADHPDSQAIVGVVEFDTPVSGEITPEHWLHIYRLNGGGRGPDRITASRQSGTLLPRVELQDANGQMLGVGNVDELGVTASFGPHELQAGGEYRVLVYRDRGIDGDTVGEYEADGDVAGLRREQHAPGGAAQRPGRLWRVLQGAITPARWYEDWQFTALAGDLITITVNRLPGATNTLRPLVVLLGGAGQEQARGNLGSTGATAAIERYKLATPGTYTIRVTRDRGKGGVTSGQYELLVSLAGSGVGSPVLAPVSGAVETRVPAEGEITNERWADTWTYTGQAGDLVDMVATRTDGTLIPRIDILDANRQPLVSAQIAITGDSASIQRYQLPASAEYFVVVSRDRGQDGVTTGAYSLVIRPSE